MKLITEYHLGQASIESTNAAECIKEAERAAEYLLNQYQEFSMQERYEERLSLAQRVLDINKKLLDASGYLELAALGLLQAHRDETDVQQV